MADVVISRLLEGSLCGEEVIKWLSNERKCLDLPTEKHNRVEFLPSFLNYVHEQFSSQNFKSTVPGSPSKQDRRNDKQDTPKTSVISASVPDTILHQNVCQDSKGISRSPCQDESVSTYVALKKHRKPQKIATTNVISTDLSKRHKNFQDSPKTAPDITDIELFPPIDACKSKTRRITPTLVSSSNDKTPKENVFPRAFDTHIHSRANHKKQVIFSSTPLKEHEDVKLADAREWLRERLVVTKNKTRKPSDVVHQEVLASSTVPGCTTPIIDNKPEIFVHPALNLVTFKKKLNAVINVYSMCLCENLIPNINIEMYFLIQLLTIKIKESQMLPKDHMGTVHNCVYFACKVLEKQTLFLKLFDNYALKMLLDISYLSEFSTPLHEMLVKLQKNFDYGSSWKVSYVRGVAFQESVDKRQNFPSDASFNAFRRQRDTFYDLFRDWQKKNVTDGWTTQELFLKRVNAIVHQNTDAINQIHLARLLVSQLIQSSCDCEELSLQGGVDENSLTELKQMFPEKFSKLSQRMVAPALQGNPCPLPSFPGVQSFFHDFLECADSAVLTRHIMDLLFVKILELNQTDVFDLDSKVEQEEHDLFFGTVHTLRLLGKFLGYLVFCPYYSQLNLPNQSNEELRNLRSCNVFQVDLKIIVQEAINNRRLILTVPWVIDYLSMADSVALNLPQYQPVINILIQIYHSSSRNISNSYSKIMLQLLLGWFFELPIFPQSVFYNFRPDRQAIQTCYLHCLDEVQFVDQKLIVSCCPYVQGINFLLKNYHSGKKSQTKEVRKITPIAAEDPSNINSQSQVQQKLEENFFHYQPSSLKRTVDFVADRVASKLIKNISYTIIPMAKTKALSRISAEVLDHAHLKGKTQLNCMISDVSVKLCHSVRKECFTKSSELGKKLVTQLMPSLLSEDHSESVHNMCSQIAYRITSEKTQKWVCSNVTVDYFIGQLKEEIPRISRSDLNVDVKLCPQIADKPYSAAIRLLRKILSALHNNEQVSKEEIISVLDLVSRCSGDGSQDNLSKAIDSIYCDFFYALLIFSPMDLNSDITDHFFQILKNIPDNLATNRLINPRNLLLLSCSKHSIESWSKMEEVISTMISRESFTLDDLAKNCLDLLTQSSLPIDSIPHLYKCLVDILNNFSRENKASTKLFQELLTKLKC